MKPNRTPREAHPPREQWRNPPEKNLALENRKEQEEIRKVDPNGRKETARDPKEEHEKKIKDGRDERIEGDQEG